MHCDVLQDIVFSTLILAATTVTSDENSGITDPYYTNTLDQTFQLTGHAICANLKHPLRLSTVLN